jgi:hypothetical protein
MPPFAAGAFVYRNKLFYIRSSAIAKRVTLNGKIIEQYPPATAYTPKKAATDIRNKTQYRLLDFLIVSIAKN